MILDDHERLRFIRYCKSEAESSKAMALQMEKLSGHGVGIAELTKRERSKAAAYTIVAMDLSSMSTVETVGPGDVGQATDVVNEESPPAQKEES